jgi:hypothetical protein
MAYRWRYENTAGAPVAGPGVDFDSQDDAEGWLGETWQSLLDAGIDQVTLEGGGEPVYGPMSLHPPQP